MAKGGKGVSGGGGKREGSKGGNGGGGGKKHGKTPKKKAKQHKPGVQSLFGAIVVSSGGRKADITIRQPKTTRAGAPAKAFKKKPRAPPLCKQPIPSFGGKRGGKPAASRSHQYQKQFGGPGGKPWKKPAPFQLQLPPVVKLHNRPPVQLPYWLHGSKLAPVVDDSNSKTKAAVSLNKRQRVRLPIDDIPDVVLTKLDWELREFAGSVRLSETELRVRQYMISELQGMVHSSFGAEAHVQVFGSFATKQVCTFASDVDCAVWGAVPTGTHVVFREKLKPVPRAETVKNQQKLQEKLQKKERKEALARKWLGAMEEGEEEEGQVSEEPSRKKQKTGSEAAGAAGSEESPLFVIDRVGESKDDEAKKDASTPTGSSKESAICIDNDLQGDDNDDDDASNSSSDSADKLGVLESEERRRLGESSAKAPTAHTVSLLSSDSSSDDDSDAGGDSSQIESEMEVSFVARGKPRVAPTTKDTGRVRKQVVDALVALSRKLRQAGWTRSVQVIKSARVPIVKMETDLGFEADIAIGGHNGTDTSLYAATQSEKYQSFATVVLLLKVLLAQNGLDEPFKGGLGSFKLYVLVTHHLQQHLELGGSDQPGEVLISFLFRYGEVKGHNVDEGSRTRLHKEVPVIEQSGSSADLSNVKHLFNCVDLFRNCWTRLWKVARGFEDSGDSLLVHLVDAGRFQRERQSCINKAEQSARNIPRSGNATSPRAARRQGPPVGTTPAPTAGHAQMPRERSAQELKASYGVNDEAALMVH